MRAHEEGLVGAVGITGHGHSAPATHLEALRRYPFATVITPLNPVLWRDDSYRADYQALVAEVRGQDAGLMTITTASRRNSPDGDGQRYATWYEPYDDQERITAAVSWVLAHEEVTCIPTAADVRLLGMLLEAERNRIPIGDGRGGARPRRRLLLAVPGHAVLTRGLEVGQPAGPRGCARRPASRDRPPPRSDGTRPPRRGAGPGGPPHW